MDGEAKLPEMTWAQAAGLVHLIDGCGYTQVVVRTVRVSRGNSSEVELLAAPRTLRDGLASAADVAVRWEDLDTPAWKCPWGASNAHPEGSWVTETVPDGKIRVTVIPAKVRTVLEPL